MRIETEGTPATLVLTEPFRELAERFARNLGMPGYPNVALPHPIAPRDDEELRRLARAAAPTVWAQLTRPPG